MGFDGLARCVRDSRRPVVAIGGMSAAAAEPCIRAGAEGMAVVAAIAGSADPCASAREIRQSVDAALARWRSR
jgi:thiamine-phosphate pyrophosphorylase